MRTVFVRSIRSICEQPSSCHMDDIRTDWLQSVNTQPEHNCLPIEITPHRVYIYKIYIHLYSYSICRVWCPNVTFRVCSFNIIHYTNGKHCMPGSSLFIWSFRYVIYLLNETPNIWTGQQIRDN